MEANRYSLLARHAPASLVAVGPGGDRSAGDLLRDADAVARALPPASSRAGRALVACDDRYRFAVCLLAAWQAGRVVALPPNGQPGTLRRLVAEDDAMIVLGDRDQLPGLDVRGVLAQPGAAPAFAPRHFEGDLELAIIFTSGSTGAPEAWTKRAAQLLGEARVLSEAFRVGPGDRILATLPPQHIYGLLFGVLLPLSSGAAFLRSTPFHAESVAASARESAATVLVSVPAHLKSLAALEPSEAPRFRLLFSSGAPLDAAMTTALPRLSHEAHEILGSTETGGMASRRPAVEKAFRPLPGVRVKEGPEGRLLLDSPFLDAGAARPFQSADRIELAADGRFLHLGRLDDVVKVAGKRLALSELERMLRAIEGVRDAAALAVSTDAARGTEVWAVVAGQGIAQPAIREALLQQLDPVLLPRRLRIVDQLPAGDNGKPTRAMLLSLFDPANGRRDLTLARRAHERTESAELVELEGEVPADLLWFSGHFENNPILPGVVQLNQLVMAECRRLWPELGGLRRLSRVKFRKRIGKGDRIALRMRREHEGRAVSYEITRAGESCSSGTLEFEGYRP
jgi:acyl-CoA synthetase (AMP-forming)/AMP-acid ligase II/3-hydroxymyristoyl/3-hydroxydecanoyl-(acyl carrier protein) dehydratase